MSLCKTNDPWGGTSFDPRDVTFVDIYKMKLHTNYQSLGLLVSEKKISKVLPIGVYVEKFDLSVKRSRSTQGHHCFQTLLGFNAAYHAPGPFALLVLKKMFKGLFFYHI